MVSHRDTIKLLTSERHIPTWADYNHHLIRDRFAAAFKVLTRHSTATPDSKISKYFMAYAWDRESLELELTKRLGARP